MYESNKKTEYIEIEILMVQGNICYGTNLRKHLKKRFSNHFLATSEVIIVIINDICRRRGN